jgi:hypothetical protein
MCLALKNALKNVLMGLDQMKVIEIYVENVKFKLVIVLIVTLELLMEKKFVPNAKTIDI